MSEHAMPAAEAAELEVLAGDFEEGVPVPDALVTPDALDALVEEDEDALPLNPVTALEDPEQGTEAGRNPTRGED